MPPALRELEANKLTLEDQLVKLDKVKSRLAENRGQRADRIARKFDAVLKRNKGKIINI